MKHRIDQTRIILFLTPVLMALFFTGQGLRQPTTAFGSEVKPPISHPAHLNQMSTLTHTVFLPVMLKPDVPNGSGKIVFTYYCICGGPRDIFTINLDGTERINLTNHTDEDSYDPAWSPDKTKIAFASNMARVDGGTDIYVMNADGSGQIRLTNSPTPVGDRFPDWSPDGSQIVFQSNNRDGDYQSEIYMMNADGSNLIQLTDHSAIEHHDLQPNWSPDGRKIAISSTRDTRPGENSVSHIYVMSADGSGAVAITDAGGADYYPRWSPDGSQIAFSSPNRGHDSDIYVVNVDGTNFTQLTFAAAFSGHFGPAWSPDGSQIAFLSRQVSGTFNEEIYTMNANGANQQRVTISQLNEGWLDW